MKLLVLTDTHLHVGMMSEDFPEDLQTVIDPILQGHIEQYSLVQDDLYGQ